jgi:hypothetical protein
MTKLAAETGRGCHGEQHALGVLPGQGPRQSSDRDGNPAINRAEDIDRRVVDRRDAETRQEERLRIVFRARISLRLPGNWLMTAWGESGEPQAVTAQAFSGGLQ